MMKALTIRQPWCWAILYAGKDIENRDWNTNLRGRIAIHAAKGMTREEYQDGIEFIALAAYEAGMSNLVEYRKIKDLVIPDYEEMTRSAIVGTVEIVSSLRESTSPWFQGRFGFQLANPRSLVQPIPIKGYLGFWDVPEDVVAMIENQLREAA